MLALLSCSNLVVGLPIHVVLVLLKKSKCHKLRLLSV